MQYTPHYILTDDCHDERPRIYGFEVTARHLQNETHVTWYGGDDPRASLYAPRLPLRYTGELSVWR